MINIARTIITFSFFAGAYVVSLDKVAVNWFYFLPAVVLGAVGVLLLKSAEKAAAKDDSLLASDKQILVDSLHNIVANLRELEGRKDKVPTYDMRFEIDRIFRADLNKFADSRESMKHLFGLMAYADIMSSFAAGERYLNRVWSASTDGYVDEVLAYVAKALVQFEEAIVEWNKVDTQ